MPYDRGCRPHIAKSQTATGWDHTKCLLRPLSSMVHLQAKLQVSPISNGAASADLNLPVFHMCHCSSCDQ